MKCIQRRDTVTLNLIWLTEIMKTQAHRWLLLWFHPVTSFRLLTVTWCNDNVVKHTKITLHTVIWLRRGSFKNCSTNSWCMCWCGGLIIYNPIILAGSDSFMLLIRMMGKTRRVILCARAWSFDSVSNKWCVTSHHRIAMNMNHVAG